MTFTNAYADARFADAYSQLQFPGTYHLAFRDLPDIFAAHVRGSRALDFGCGAGRSTRFLRERGFEVIGVDIAASMLARARASDPGGDYRLMDDESLGGLAAGAFDLVLSAFTFDNIPGVDRRVELLRRLAALLAPGGRLVNLVSSPDIYTHEWASFSTAAYPGNRQAASGDVVLIVNTAISDARPVQDVLWTDEAYLAQYEQGGLAVVETFRPLATGGEPWAWVNETRIAPWVIYVLARGDL